MLFSKTAADGTDRVRVKICGLTREDDVVAVTDAGADAVGFVCYPGSTRFVPPTRLMSLACLVPESVTKVLVFVNPTAEEVREYLSFFPDATLQFHGNESRAFCDQFHAPYLKSVHFDRPERLIEGQANYPWAAGLLADAKSEIWSGAGINAEEAARIRQKITKPLLVAGGLKENNVIQAIKLLKPWAVDVLAGVEAARGIKDPAKVNAFMQAVRRASEQS